MTDIKIKFIFKWGMGFLLLFLAVLFISKPEVALARQNSADGQISLEDTIYVYQDSAYINIYNNTGNDVYVYVGGPGTAGCTAVIQGGTPYPILVPAGRWSFSAVKLSWKWSPSFSSCPTGTLQSQSYFYTDPSDFVSSGVAPVIIVTNTPPPPLSVTSPWQDFTISPHPIPVVRVDSNPNGGDPYYTAVTIHNNKPWPITVYSWFGGFGTCSPFTDYNLDNHTHTIPPNGNFTENIPWFTNSCFARSYLQGAYYMFCGYHDGSSYPEVWADCINPLVEVTNPAPTISSISPATKNVGDGAFAMTLNGSGFYAEGGINYPFNSIICWLSTCSQVKWDGTLLNGILYYPDTRQLTANVPASYIVPGDHTITVYNNGPGGGTSNGVSFKVNSPVPSLTSISSPTSKIAGDLNFTLTVNGSGFYNGSKVRWNGADLTTTYVSASQLTAAVPAANIATAGTYPVTVFNAAPGGGLSSAVNFIVHPRTITSSTWQIYTSGGAAVSGTQKTCSSQCNYGGISSLAVGDYFIKLDVTNNFGKTSSANKNFTIQVASPPTGDIKAKDGGDPTVFPARYSTYQNGPIYVDYQNPYGIYLSWTSANATNCTVTGVSGLSGTSNAGVFAEVLGVSKTYTLNCTGPGGTANVDSVVVNIPPMPTNLTVNPSADGKTATFNWTVPGGYTTSRLRVHNDTDGVWVLDDPNVTTLPYTINTLYNTAYTWYVWTEFSANGALSQYAIGSSFTSGGPPVQLNINKTGATLGTITGSPADVSGTGINCGSACTSQTLNYISGTAVNLTAAPVGGNIFTGWSGCCSGTNPACSITMNSAKTCTAGFSLPYTLNINKPTGGTITSSDGKIDCGDNGNVCSVTYGNVAVNLTAVPSPGYVFVNWGGACSGTITTCALTMTSDTTVGSTFALPDFTLHNSGSLDTNVVINGSAVTTSITITATPNLGFNNLINFDTNNVVISPSIPGVTWNFSNSNLNQSEYSTGSVFSLTIPADTPPGPYSITIIASGGGVTRTITMLFGIKSFNPTWEEF